jgi:hypothetical protein
LLGTKESGTSLYVSTPLSGKPRTMAKWWNKQTRGPQKAVPRKGVGVQLSPWSLICRLGRCLTDSHKVGVPGSIPGPATSSAGGRGPAGVHISSQLGATPRPATASGRVRKLVKRPGREPVILWVRLPPRLLPRSRGPAAKTPGPHPGNDGSSPSGITRRSVGVGAALFRVKARRPGSTPGRTSEYGGECTLGREPASHAGCEGSIPSVSTDDPGAVA